MDRNPDSQNNSIRDGDVNQYNCISNGIPFKRKAEGIQTQTVPFETGRLYVFTVESLPGKNCTFQKVKIGVDEVQKMNGFTHFCPVSSLHGQI
ncbi:hypothetical protein [Chitinophaga filiformis]|uniref:Uncharacterized protein n=1 Tax=Chitinophaga filiformis TaxID=104663 RepID=A0ABY4I373_CHIFI|nr:hypothetical protein [Chitinophaga filiformis]UPK70078.1 hypothetical protein MYF79_02075 [Chitinophaga filiformis]